MSEAESSSWKDFPLNNGSRVHGELWCYVGEVVAERF